MSRLTDKIAAINDIEEKIVDVPEWEVKIGIRSMDGNRRSQFMTAFSKAREAGNDDEIGKIEADLLVYCAYDPEDNSSCFTAEDIPLLLTKSGKVIGRLSKIASELSGLSPEAEKKTFTPSSV